MATSTKSKSTTQTPQTVDYLDYGIDLSYIATLFENVHEAKLAYNKLKRLNDEGFLEIVDAAYVEKTGSSKIKVHDHNDWEIGESMVGGGISGVVIGTILGLVGGAILLPAAVGAGAGILIGGAVSEAYDHDTTFDHGDLKDLAKSLPVGTSALVAMTEDEFVEETEVEMAKLGGKTIQKGSIPNSVIDAAANKQPSK